MRPSHCACHTSARRLSPARADLSLPQVELHPFNPQHELVAWCRKRDILLEAYCPLGSTNSPLLSDPELIKIAEKHSVSPATILISYQPARGIVVLPKSVSAGRIEQNLQLIELDESDLEVLNAMAAKGKQQRVNTPLFGWDLVSSPRLFPPRRSFADQRRLFGAAPKGFDDWYPEQAAAKLANGGYDKTF